MTDTINHQNYTLKKFGQINSNPNMNINGSGKQYSVPINKTLQENLKDLKNEIIQLEKNFKSPLNKQILQVHANKSHEKAMSATVRQERSQILKTRNNHEDAQAIYDLIDAKDRFVREKQREIYDANEEFRQLLIEAQNLKREQIQQKQNKIEQHNRNYEKRLQEAKKQFEMQVNMLKQQLRTNIEEEEIKSRTSLKMKIAELEQSSVFGRTDSVHYSKLTPSKKEKLYASYSNTPYKQEREEQNQEKQNSYGITRKSELQNKTDQYNLNSNSQIKSQRFQNTSTINPALYSCESEKQYKVNNYFGQPRSCRNYNNAGNKNDIDDFFARISPKKAKSKLQQLKEDINQLQKSTSKRFPNESNQNKRGFNSTNYSPISKDFLMKSNKKSRDDTYLSSSSEEENKFRTTYQEKGLDKSRVKNFGRTQKKYDNLELLC